MRRWAVIVVLVAAWWLVSWLHWRQTVAVVPTWSIPLRGRAVELTGELADVVFLKSVDSDGRLKEPIELIQPDGIFRSRLALRVGDQLLRMSCNGMRAVVARDGVVVVLATDSEQAVCTLTAAAEARTAWFSGNGRVVVVQTSSDVAGFDSHTGQELWRRPSVVVDIRGEPVGQYERESVILVSKAERIGQFLITSSTQSVDVLTGLDRPVSTPKPSGRKQADAGYGIAPASLGPAERVLEWISEKLGLTFKTRAMRYAITQLPERRDLGLVTTGTPEDWDHRPSNWVSGPDAILVRTRERLNYYSIPPDRDWETLLKWCLAPVVAVGFVSAVIRQIRLQLSPISIHEGSRPDSN